jgi:hypothetical protein
MIPDKDEILFSCLLQQLESFFDERIFDASMIKGSTISFRHAIKNEINSLCYIRLFVCRPFIGGVNQQFPNLSSSIHFRKLMEPSRIRMKNAPAGRFMNKNRWKEEIEKTLLCIIYRIWRWILVGDTFIVHLKAITSLCCKRRAWDDKEI